MISDYYVITKETGENRSSAQKQPKREGSPVSFTKIGISVSLEPGDVLSVSSSMLYINSRLHKTTVIWVYRNTRRKI